jgi:TRAP-type C4-dicarboxylate transport system permease small subunit
LRSFLQRLAEAIGVALFVALVATFAVQVAARFAFNRPLPWTDELAVVIYLAVVLWAGALLVRWRSHVAMDVFVAVLPRPLQRAMLALGALTVAALAAVSLPATADWVWFMRREGTPVLGWPLHLVYAPVLLLWLAVVLRGLQAAWQAWQQPERFASSADPMR